MRTLLILLFITTTFFTYSQKKGDNMIVVKTNFTFSNLKFILFDNGYMIEGSDTVYIQTTSKQLKSSSVLKMQIKRTDTLKRPEIG